MSGIVCVVFMLVQMMSVCMTDSMVAQTMYCTQHTNTIPICYQVMSLRISSEDEKEKSDVGYLEGFKLKLIESLSKDKIAKSNNLAEELRNLAIAMASKAQGNMRAHWEGLANILSIFPGQEDLFRGPEPPKGMKGTTTQYRKLADKLSKLLHDSNGNMADIQSATVAL